MKSDFWSLQWLKDANNEWSYARVIGAISIISNLIWRFYMGVGNINSWPAAVAGCCGIIGGIFLWAFEIVRENKKVSIGAGEKTYGVKIGE